MENSVDMYEKIKRYEYPLSSEYKLILGSSSRNRKKVLETINWPFTIMSPDIDEKAIRSKNLLELPQLIATEKATAILQKLTEQDTKENLILITTDQVVIYQGQLREKPENEAEATHYLSSYSGDHVTTVSAVVATHYPSERQVCDIDIAHIHWNEIPNDVIKRVVQRGEIFSSAGGFRIEDPDLNPLIKSMEGSIDSIMGMPIALTVKLINTVRDIVPYELYMLSNRSLNLRHHKSNPSNKHDDNTTVDNADHSADMDSTSYPLKRRVVSSLMKSPRSRSNTEDSLSSFRSKYTTSSEQTGSGIGGEFLLIGQKSARTISPTDRKLSPVSQRISIRHTPSLRVKSYSTNTPTSTTTTTNSINTMNSFHLASNIIPTPYPFNETFLPILIKQTDIKKQQLFDLLQWPYTTFNIQMDSNIDILKNGPNLSPLVMTENMAKNEANSITHALKTNPHTKANTTIFSTTPVRDLSSINKNIQEGIIVTTSHVAICESVCRYLPKDSNDVILFLSSYSNQKVMIVTSVVTTFYPNGKQAYDNDIAVIQFKELDPDLILSLSTQPDILSSIGAINIENKELNTRIKYIDGTIDSLIGMPIQLIQRLLLNVATVTNDTTSNDLNIFKQNQSTKKSVKIVESPEKVTKNRLSLNRRSQNNRHTPPESDMKRMSHRSTRPVSLSNLMYSQDNTEDDNISEVSFSSSPSAAGSTLLSVYGNSNSSINNPITTLGTIPESTMAGMMVNTTTTTTSSINKKSTSSDLPSSMFKSLHVDDKTSTSTTHDNTRQSNKISTLLTENSTTTTTTLPPLPPSSEAVFISPLSSIPSSTVHSSSHSPRTPRSGYTDCTPKWIILKCPGKRIPIRSKPDVTSTILRYVTDKDKIYVNIVTIHGFYALLNEEGFINRATKGVEWIEHEE